jgi:Restriction Endonuclease associating with ARP
MSLAVTIMTFLERERRRLVKLRDKMFKDAGLGMFFGRPREFVLSNPAANLWEGIRADAVDYFEENKIPWWKGDERGPTGHMLSSQVACVNHLYLLRQRPDLARALLCGVDSDILDAEIVDTGYVEFEFVGQRQYLSEKSFKRGMNCTSVDAFMIGRTASGDRRAFFIEWKYTEAYRPKDKYLHARSKVYDRLIKADDSPFKEVDVRALYFEPFYQMMRQTLLGWQCVLNKDHECTSYRHVHVVPEQNREFHLSLTSPSLHGATVSEAWRDALKQPEFYVDRTPACLMGPLRSHRETKSLFNYLERRYWAGT